MKKIAFIMNNMTSGGVQVSLINLLKKISKKNIEITLLLTSASGEYLEDVPKNIKIIQIFENNILQKDNVIFYNSISLKDKPIATFLKIYHKVINKVNKKHINEYLLKKSKKIDEEYDYVIDYLGYGSFCTYYSIYGVKGHKKITFIHDEKTTWIENVKDIYCLFDNIYCVSNSCKKLMSQEFPNMKEKIEICRNIVDKEKIYKLSQESCTITDKCLTILTIGRLEIQKGYDLLIDIAILLKENGIEYKWYIIGEGSLRKEIENNIIKNNLSENIVLLGMQKNPYKYMKRIDIYVQPSRHEGYGIAIAEARVLCKPIVATDIDCIKEQIIDGKNGLIAKFDKQDFCSKIQDIYLNNKLKEKLINNLKEDKNNEIIDIEKLLDI